jgi:hypothetical protein
MGEHDDLLRRFQPGLRYDSMEQFFADSAEQWAVNPYNELRRADADSAPGELVAKAPELTLAFLNAGHYADSTEVRDGDRIGNTARNYREQYVALRKAHPDLSNRMYGHAVEASGHLWLQYWLFHFYNDYNLALGVGLHEGDWEMVQLRMHGDEPDIAVYSQHRRAERRAWSEVERVPSDSDRPLVYVARGSHAAYFEKGFHQTDAWYDLADGKRNAPRLALEIISDDGPPWVLWPGVWGDTHARLHGIDQPSPPGPSAHRSWRHPDSVLDNAWEPQRTAAIDAPQVTVARENGQLRIDFDFSPQQTAAATPAVALQVTVNSCDEARVPPRTYNFGVAEATRGTLLTRIPLDPAKHYDVYVSTTAGDPPIPSESDLTLIAPVRTTPQTSRLDRLTQWIGTLIARVRGQFSRR